MQNTLLIFINRMDDFKKDLANLLQEYHGNVSPERSLFLAVIFQALLDATKPTNENESKQSVLNRQKAVGWFSTSVGVTASNFTDICDMANLESQYVRDFAYKVIHSREKTFIRYRLNKILHT